MVLAAIIVRVHRALEQLGTDCSMAEVVTLCPELTRNQVFIAIDYPGFGVGACPKPEGWRPASVSCPSFEESEGLLAWRPCQQVWLLSLVLLIGLSACGPMPADPAASLESRTSLSGPSTSHSVPQNSSSSMTERTQEGATESVVIPADLNDDAGSEPDNWSVVPEMAQSEYEAEQEERSDGRKH